MCFLVGEDCPCIISVNHKEGPQKVVEGNHCIEDTPRLPEASGSLVYWLDLHYKPMLWLCLSKQ